MAKPSRWSQWVIAESGDSTFPMPWSVGDRVRKGTQRARAALPGSMVNGGILGGVAHHAH